MTSMQCHQKTYESCSPVNCPSMTNPGQTQCYGESRTYHTDYGMGKTQTTQCYTTQTPAPRGYGSGSSYGMGSNYGTGQTYGMGSAHGAPDYSHGPSYGHGNGYGHGLTHNDISNGYGHGHGHGHVSSAECMSQTTYGSNGMACYGKAKKKGHHYHRNRDGHCSDSCSDSDSDNEGYGRRMRC